MILPWLIAFDQALRDDISPRCGTCGRPTARWHLWDVPPDQGLVVTQCAACHKHDPTGQAAATAAQPRQTGKA